jgi:hypothetical protein
MERPEDVSCPTILGSLSMESIAAYLPPPRTKRISGCKTLFPGSDHLWRHQAVLALFLLICQCDRKSEGRATGPHRAGIEPVPNRTGRCPCVVVTKSHATDGTAETASSREPLSGNLLICVSESESSCVDLKHDV